MAVAEPVRLEIVAVRTSLWPAVKLSAEAEILVTVPVASNCRSSRLSMPRSTGRLIGRLIAR